MIVANLAAFITVAAVVIVTPGQDTALTIRNSLLGGRAAGLATAAGVASGQAIWTLFTSAGLAALLIASEPLFFVLKFAGAAYLVYLGGQALVAAIRGGASTFAPNTGTPARLSPVKALRQGCASNLANPKMIAFFPSLLPQFVPHNQESFGSLATLGLLFSCMTLVWLVGYASLVSRAGDLFRRRGLARTLEAVMGAVLVGLGLRLATQHR